MPHASNSELSLVILVAGRGSRFGGPKQLAQVGPDGEPLWALTARQAQRAGFNRIVLVTRAEIAEPLEALARKFVALPVTTVAQDAAGLPQRTKPWGTGHAVATCADVLTGAFGVANGDDFYGDPSLEILADFLQSSASDEAAIIGFRLGALLSDSGGVSRGLCAADADGSVTSIVETNGLRRSADVIIDDEGTAHGPETLVSMGLWGLPGGMATTLRDGFESFVGIAGEDVEYQLPTEIEKLRQLGVIKVKLFESSGQWLGLTHRDDLTVIESAFSDSRPA